MTTGSDLPQIALDRIARASASGVRTSLLSVPSAASAKVVGLDPVGEVMGCIVQHVGWQGWAGCGYWMGPSTVQTTQFGSYRPYVDAVRHGYDTALRRLADEAKLLGADGVIDIRIAVTMLGRDNYEYVALGTAVRLGDRRSGLGTLPAALPTPFLTELPGADVAKLMLAGWMPTDIVYGIALAIRHDDWQTLSQTQRWVNAEVTGYTELSTNVWHQARRVVTSQTAQCGAAGALVTSTLVRIWEQEPSEQHRDHLAECRMFGTAIVGFQRPGAGATPAPLSFLPLNTRTGER